MWALGVLAIAALGVLSPAAADEQNALYDRLFPHHARVCALSRIRPLDAPAGGSAGHAVIYLSDICRRPGPYPQLEPCEGGEGVGVSVNKVFRNVNWVAVPGRRLFFDGNLGAGERLTRAHFEELIDSVVEQGVFDGVQVHDSVLARRPADMGLTEFVARESVGTDFALRFARTAVCAYLPMPPPLLARVAESLNALNREYAEGDADYEWSGYHDNCTHTIHNALAGADVWGALRVNVVKAMQVFNLAVPANEAVSLATLANDYRIEDFPRLYANPRMRRTLLEERWLPAGPGGLVRVYPVHEPNDLYDPTFEIFVFENPLLRTTTWRARRMTADPRYTQLGANLDRWQGRYRGILESRSAGEGGSGDFARARAQYYAYVEDQLRQTEAWLRLLEGPQ